MISKYTDYFLMEGVAFEYQGILKKIMHYKNGKVSDSMQKLGIDYNLNYGLAIPVINEIASSIKKNNELAFYCWNQNVRESKLMALQLFITDSISQNHLEAVLDGIINPELAEQAAIKLLCKLKNSFEIIPNLLKSKNEFVQYSGLLTFKLLIKSDNIADDKIFIEIVENISKISLEFQPFIKRGLAGALLQLGKRNSALRDYTINWIGKYKADNQDITKWLNQEVIYYLNT